MGILNKLYKEYKDVQWNKQYIAKQREQREIQKPASTYTRNAVPEQQQASEAAGRVVQKTTKKIGLPRKPAGYRGTVYPQNVKYHSSLGVVR